MHRIEVGKGPLVPGVLGDPGRVLEDAAEGLNERGPIHGIDCRHVWSGHAHQRGRKERALPRIAIALLKRDCIVFCNSSVDRIVPAQVNRADG
jgi:hypothetical protein